MDKLSERLDAEIAILQKQAAEVRPKSIQHWELSQSIALLTEAAKLARRVEEAPVADAGSDGWVECSVPPELGQRVRLVREE